MVNPQTPKDAIWRLGKALIVGPRLSTITPYPLIFIRNDVNVLEKSIKMLSRELKTTF